MFLNLLQSCLCFIELSPFLTNIFKPAIVAFPILSLIFVHSTDRALSFGGSSICWLFRVYFFSDGTGCSSRGCPYGLFSSLFSIWLLPLLRLAPASVGWFGRAYAPYLRSTFDLEAT